MPFDPVRMAREAERQAFRWNRGEPERRYTRFRASRHYGGNVAGDVAGCNLRCAFCWAWPTAFRPWRGMFHSPRRAAERLAAAGPYRVARLTGGEPLIGWPHTRAVAEIMTGMGYLFILETNGILIGSGDVDPREIPRGVHVRVSIKAPTPEVFERVTGADRRGLHLQLRSLERLLEAGLEPGRDFHASLVMGLAPPREYSWVIERLASISPSLIESLEEEFLVLYPHVRRMLEKRRLRPYLAWDPEKREWVRG